MNDYVTITSIGISGSNYRDPETVRMWDQIVKTALDYPGIIRVHSFHADMEEKTMSFAIVQAFDGRQREQERERFLAEIEKAFPDMKVELYTSLNA